MEGRPTRLAKADPELARQANRGLVLLAVIGCVSTAVYIAIAVLSRHFGYEAEPGRTTHPYRHGTIHGNVRRLPGRDLDSRPNPTEKRPRGNR